MMRLFCRLAATASVLVLAGLLSVSMSARAPVYASCAVEVSDALGQPMAGALVVFRAPNGKLARTIETTSKGSCIASGLISGVTYDATVSACGFLPVTRQVTPNADGPLRQLSARLEKAYASRVATLAKTGDSTGAICGLVVDGSCRPVPGTAVILEGGDIKEPLQTKADAQGLFDFPALQPASAYRVYATAEGLSTVIRKPVAVSAGETTTMEIYVRP